MPYNVSLHTLFLRVQFLLHPQILLNRQDVNTVHKVISDRHSGQQVQTQLACRAAVRAQLCECRSPGRESARLLELGPRITVHPDTILIFGNSWIQIKVLGFHNPQRSLLGSPASLCSGLECVHVGSRAGQRQGCLRRPLGLQCNGPAGRAQPPAQAAPMSHLHQHQHHLHPLNMVV